MSFPGLDVVFRLAAPAIELLVQRSATAMAEVGDDEAGIGAVAPASTRAMMRRTRLQLPAASWNSLKRRTLPAAGAALKRPAVLSSRPPTWRVKVRVGARPRT